MIEPSLSVPRISLPFDCPSGGNTPACQVFPPSRLNWGHYPLPLCGCQHLPRAASESAGRVADASEPDSLQSHRARDQSVQHLEYPPSRARLRETYPGPDRAQRLHRGSAAQGSDRCGRCSAQTAPKKPRDLQHARAPPDPQRFHPHQGLEGNGTGAQAEKSSRLLHQVVRWLFSLSRKAPETL